MEAALEGISDKVPKGQGEEPPPPPEVPAGYLGESEEARKAWEGVRCLRTLSHPRALVPLQTETLLLQAERRALCACWPAGR